MAKTPSRSNASVRKPMPPGGTWAKRFLPSQKTKVAMAIKTPGTPKAQCGPYHSSSHGVSSMEAKAPRLMEK